MTAPRLYHFTCDHGHAAIQADGGLLRPNPAGLYMSVVWLTVLPEPDKFSTGLGAVLTTCNRMAYCYIAESGSAARAWLFSGERMRTPRGFLADLESYGDPEHWWISDVPVAAAWDPSWQARAVTP
jgi:hypothetical protein